MPLLLELFAGTKSIGKAFAERGWEVISVDIDPSSNPTIRCDIAQFETTRELRDRNVDAIWASPPCTNYSIARHTGPAANLEQSDGLVRKTLEIATQLGCPLFIENPWTGSLKRRGLLDSLNLRLVDYCMYGMPYRKRTAIWTNTAWCPLRSLCKRNCASFKGGKHAARAQQGPPGPRFTQQELYRIPAALCEEIADYTSQGGEIP